MSPRSSVPRVARSLARSAEPLLSCSSSNVPPLKSIPKFRPWVKYSVIARIDSTAEIGKLIRRKRMKSNLVSSGTMRTAGTSPSTLTMVSATMKTPNAINIQVVVTSEIAHGSDRHRLRPLPAHPVRHDQACDGERGEHRGDDA